MTSNAELVKMVARVLRVNGLSRKGSTWYFDGPEVAAVLNLQKEGLQYYVNLGFWIKSLGDESWPKERMCHVRSRATNIWPDSAFEIDQLLFNVGPDGFTDEQRACGVPQFLEERVVPFMKATASLAALRHLVSSNWIGLRRFLVRRDAWQVLGVDPDAV